VTSSGSTEPGAVAIPRGWQAADIPSLSGRVAVVTGGNAGLGYYTALELARHGARVILACRDTDKGAGAAASITGQALGAEVRVSRCDLASLESVRSFAAGLADGEPVDVLVNNAGVMASPHRVTQDGFELQIGTNHFGHFALTALLLPRLLAAPQPRVVTLSSGLHVYGTINFGDLNSRRHYRRYRAYCQSKLANLLFTLELDRRARQAGTPLTSVAAHPGYAATGLQTAGTSSALVRAIMTAGNLAFAVPAQEGALPSLCAATFPGLPGGSYIGPGQLGGFRGSPGYNTPSKKATDPATAARLWDVSEQATGASFAFPGRSEPGGSRE
jgi:NAD(P)-dependent dehydrogenase (short-subunit alcohol dehydrogenase family)